ncbi:hypothetical protein D3C72_199760 [compost metagenome]
MAKRTLQCVESHSVLYHPDYDRRPRDHTESADLIKVVCRKQTGLQQALAGYTPKRNYRRWGIAPRPENVNLMK